MMDLCNEHRAEVEDLADRLCDLLDDASCPAAMAAMGSVMVALYNAHAEDYSNMDEALLEWIAILITSTTHRRHSYDN